jgi:hypothetical protein
MPQLFLEVLALVFLDWSVLLSLHDLPLHCQVWNYVMESNSLVDIVVWEISEFMNEILFGRKVDELLCTSLIAVRESVKVVVC